MQVLFNAVKLYIENCILISFTCSVFHFPVFVLVYLLGYYYDRIISGHVTFDHLHGGINVAYQCC